MGLGGGSDVSKSGSKPSGNGLNPSQATNPLLTANQPTNFDFSTATVPEPTDFGFRKANISPIQRVTQQINIEDDVEYGNRVAKQNKRLEDVKERQSIGGSIADAAKSGVATLGAIASSIPSGIIDTFGSQNGANTGAIGALGVAADWLKDLNLGDGKSAVSRYLTKMANAPFDMQRELEEMSSSDVDAEVIGQKVEKYIGLPEEYNPLSPNNGAVKYLLDIAKKNNERANKGYSGGISQAIADGNYNDAWKLTAINTVQSLPIMAGIVAARGAGATELQSLVGLGVGTMETEYKKLKEENPNIDNNLLKINATLTGLGESGSELVGTSMLFNQARKLFQSGAKKEAEELLKGGVQEFLNTAFKRSFVGAATMSDASGEMGNQVWKNAVDKWSGVRPDVDYTDGVLDAGIISLASTGSIAGVTKGLSNVLKPSAKKAVQEDIQNIETLNSDIDNPNVDGATKEVLLEQVGNLTEKVNDEIETADKETEKLTPTQRQEAVNVSEQIDKLQAVINSPNVQESTKKAVQKQIDDLTKQADAIAPTESTPITKGTDVAIDDTVELVNGRTGVVQKVEGNQITMKMENGSTFMATPEMVEMSVLRPIEDPVETNVVEVLETPVEVKETIVEPVNAVRKKVKNISELRKDLTQKEDKDLDDITDSIINDGKGMPQGYTAKVLDSYRENGITNTIVEVKSKEGNKFLLKENTDEIRPIGEVYETPTEVVTEEVIPEAEVVPTETVQEALDVPVLKKAEDDLTALKKVTNKVQKYQASVKRLNEAYKAGNITQAQFEETKQRFDDVITDSDVSVPKVTNLTPQETIELDNELKNENLTTNDFIQYERARAIEDISNATEVVQESSDDTGGSTTETTASETAQRNFAVQEINKGAINWDGDRFSPRPDLGLDWADIRKGQTDLLAGKDTPASKRLVEAIDKARKEGGYNFIQGSGKIVNRIFVPLESDYAETQLTESDLKNIKDNEDQLAKEYDEWFSQLSDEDKQQEINFTEDGKQIDQTAESKADVSNQKDAVQSKTAQNKVRVIQEKRQSIKDRISQKLKDQRGQLNSGFDASLISDFIELGSTYIEEGIVNATDFIKRFREDYKDLGFDDSTITDEQITQEILSPNQKQETSDKFFKLAHKNIQSDEVSNTLNNVERETGRELTQEEKEYKVTKRTEAVNYGYDVIEAAKEEYGDRYVTELLRFLDENARTLSIENKALITISLELDLERQLQENPSDITLNKQLKLVRDVSTRQQRSAAIATGYGILRQIARVGYDINQVTDQFFTNQQLEDRRKLAKAVESTPDDINKEADVQEGAINVTEDVKVTPKKRKPRLGLSEAQQAEKQALAKEFRGVFNDVTRIATLLADKKFMRYAKLVLLDTAGDFESFATSMIENVGEGIREHLPKIYQKIGGTDDIRPLTEAQKAKKSSVKDIVKKALIDKGYGREITVTLTERDADGNAVLTDKGIVSKIKEKREVIDWKKLAGEEGSVDNIRNNVEASLRESGYSDADISAIQTELVDEYNRLHASIIEKSIRELESRNKEREPIDAKTSARRLAELYNYGLFEEDSDTYDNIVNNAIGLNKIGQEAFNDAKKLAKSLSDLYRSTDENGRRITEFGLKEAIRNINTQIEDLLSKVAWEQSNKAFKIATVVKEYMNFAQRAMLQTMKQIIENPFSGSIQRLFTILGYMGEVDSKDLRVARRLASVRVYEDIVRNGGLTYGEITTPLVNKSKLEEKLNKVSDSKLYHTAISGLLGRAYLDGADSMHKTALTERYFVHNLVRILQKRGMTKQEAIDYVSAQLTGQRFNDALGTAKSIIDATNEKAGKKVLPDNPQAVFRLATNIVKDALVVGDNISLRELEASYEAAYKAAGYDLGHEANNLVSAMLGSSTTKVENAIKLAVKEKKWNEATALTFISILNKNILNPFVGGGTNWMVLTLQKAGVDIISPVRDYAKMKDNPLDITTQAGIKNIENSLLANLRFKNTANRVVIGAMASVLVASVAIGSGADDDLNDWLKKNEWARKYFNVLSPQALVLLVSLENKEVGDYLAQLMGIKYDNYSDAKKLYQGLTGVIDDNSNKNRKGWAKLGEVVGGHTSFPGPWRVAKDLEKIARSVQGKPERKSESGGKGFASGYFRGGLIDYLGFRPMGKNGQPLSEEDMNKAIDEALESLRKNK